MTEGPAVRRWRTLLTPIALLAALLVWPAPAAHAAEDDDPLQVTLTNIAPSSIPRSGPVVIAGQVRNSTDEVWTDVRVYPLFSSDPMTTTDEIAEAAASDPATTASGSRLTDEDQFTEISRLEPGEAVGFRIRLPRRVLPISGAPGVYWVGAQALGTSTEGRDLLADGRARSFMPLVPRKASAELSLIAPLRQQVDRDVRSRVVDPAGTAALFGPDGRLGRLVSTLADEPDITWLVDPALLDVAADLGDNNPPLSLGPEPPKGGAPSESPSPSTSPSTSTNAQGSPARTLDEDAREDTADWLGTVTTVLSRSETRNNVLTLPYADADAFALLRDRSGLLKRAHELANSRLEARGLGGRPAIATPNRHVDTKLLGRAAERVVAVAAAPAADAPATAEVSEHRVVLSRQAVAEGGPGPERPLSALNLRQRILAEAALHAIAGAGDPLVVTLPDSWDPGTRWSQASFTRGLQPDWLDLVPLPVVATGEVEDLRYTRQDRRAEVDGKLIESAQQLMRTSSALSHLLESENNVALRLRGMALAGASYASRPDQSSAASLIDTMSDTVKGLTDRVSVVGTQFVTLSGGSGTITVSLINDLPQPVRIGLDVSADYDEGLEFENTEPVVLQPDQRTTVRIQVRTSRLGINDVTISPTLDDGRTVGTPLEVTIRSSEVGRWFWSVMIGAGCVLVVMIAKRIRDRIRNRRWRPVEEQ